MAKTALLRRLSDVDFRLLRVFRAVVACGGVSAAEIELNIGRSTISRHLTDLEVRLGCKLCHRGPAGFSLTDEGERIHVAALQLFSAIHEFQAEVDETNKYLTGNLSIAFFDKSMTNRDAKVPQAIHLFQQTASKVDIEVHVDAINNIETGVLNGQYQVGIVPMHKRSENLDYHPLYSEHMYLYCGKLHPLFNRSDGEITRGEMQEQRYAGFAFHSPNMMASHDWKLQRRAIVNNEEALATLVLSGCYVGFLPDHFTRHFTETGEMRALMQDTYSYRSDHAAIIRRLPKMPRRVERFLDCLQQVHGVKTQPGS
ncbi:MAG: LysR family transcriptional regulator [Stappiaceae bacterium]